LKTVEIRSSISKVSVNRDWVSEAINMARTPLPEEPAPSTAADGGDPPPEYSVAEDLSAINPNVTESGQTSQATHNTGGSGLYIRYATLLIWPGDSCLTESRRPEDVVIAVMGITGSGKSTFISHFVEGVPVGHTLEACGFFNLCKWVRSKRVQVLVQ
jgi:hypothetical protein